MTQCGDGRSAQGTWGEPVGCLPYPSVALTSAVALRRSRRARSTTGHTPHSTANTRNAPTSTVTPAARPSTTSKISLQTPTTARPSVVKPASANRCPSRDQRAARVLAEQHPMQHDRTDEQPARRSARRAAPATGHPSYGPAAPWASHDGPSSSTPRRRGAGRRRASWRPRSGHNRCPTPLGGPRTTCAATGRPPRAGPWRRGPLRPSPQGFQNVAHAAEQRCSVAFDGRA
jgi:hypothetical protein